MTEDDFDDFSKVIVGFAEIRSVAISPAAIALYWRAMQHWEIDLFKTAAAHLLRTHTRHGIPQPSDFEALRAAWQNTTAEAWARARAHARTLYTPTGWKDAPIGDYLIDTAIASIGGYCAISTCSLDSIHWLEKRFAERLAELQDVISTRAALPHVADRLALPPTNGPVALKKLLPRL